MGEFEAKPKYRPDGDHLVQANFATDQFLVIE
jgi:hypothetical protein